MQQNILDSYKDLSPAGLLKLSGKDVMQLLQGQLTCDVREISESETRLAAHCNPQGRIISLSRLILLQGHYYLLMPEALIPLALKALSKYAVFFKVNIEATSLDTLGYYGSQIHDHLSHLPESVDAMLTLPDYSVIRLPGTTPRYQFIGEKKALTFLREKIKTHAKEMTTNTWQALDIASGIPCLYPETSEKFLPHELNLQMSRAISFQKGCYTGQEIIARMQYRGKLKKHLYRAEIHSTLAPVRGSAIYREQEACGYLVDFSETDLGHYEGLVILDDADTQSNLYIDPTKKEKLCLKSYE